ncbi:hypothetical protein BPTFM16_01239 [Altererythrobacter insulae]|nr:hypothetical protein BPTFM16_01239 [Altererythrobacter insulae]
MPTDIDQKDRSIALTVTPVLTYPSPGNYGANFTVTQTEGDPQSMNGRVDRHGNIRLNNLPNNAKYNDNVDIVISLDDSQLKDEHGNPLSGRWATSTEYSGKGPVTGFCWFAGMNEDGSYDADLPMAIENMSTSRLDDTTVLIDDDTTASAPDYAYCLGLVLPDKNNYYITLDPRIGSKGTVNNSFMLKD